MCAVCIHSPPRAPGDDEEVDMYDPDTYHRKFEQYGEIVFITICLANGALMKVNDGQKSATLRWSSGLGIFRLSSF